ncbi:MAG: LCP family protein [Oscillospiraceae bacterium]|jgi:LCP family protein required for cell wall assembly|nr:LytR_cpsA_psr domain-containing protein [Ruminococcaceae bacterium BL-4]
MTDSSHPEKDRDIYSYSKGKGKAKDIYSSTKRPSSATGKGSQKSRKASPSSHYKTQEETLPIDCYNYVETPENQVSRSERNHPFRGNDRGDWDNHKKSHRHHHLFRRILGILLVFLIILGVILTMLYSQMDRSGNTDQSKYVAQPTNAPTYSVMSDPFVTNILLLGLDKLNAGAQRSDSIMLLSIDHHHHTIKLTSFLRDLYLAVPENGMDKLNAAYAYGGAALTMQTIENNFRIKIDKYIAVDMDGLADIITDLGGIDVTMDQDLVDQLNHDQGTSYPAGNLHLTGADAVYYARIRKVGTDFGRTTRQREVIQKLLKKVFSPSGITKLPDILKKLRTNIPAIELTGITFLSSPAVFYHTKTFYVPLDGSWKDATVDVGMVLVPDLPQNCLAIRKFIYETDSTS